jgi:hypothetical protein
MSAILNLLVEPERVEERDLLASNLDVSSGQYNCDRVPDNDWSSYLIKPASLLPTFL